MNKTKAKFNFRTIEVQEIRDAFAKVKTAKSFGTDNISSYFLKLALPFIEKSLAFMFNTSIETSMSPDSWKIARFTHIYKNGDRADKSNYCPTFLKHGTSGTSQYQVEQARNGSVTSGTTQEQASNKRNEPGTGQ